VCKGLKQEGSRESRGDFCAEIGNSYDGNWGL